jgi:hypothetical protein
MAAAHNGNAKGGNSLDRFLIRAIIALTFLMLGVVLGFSLAVFVPSKSSVTSVADQQVVAESPAAEVEQPTPSAESPAVEAVETPPKPVAEEPPAGEDAETDGAGEAEPLPEVEPTPEVEPMPGVEPPPMSGNLIVEVRDVTGEARDKGDIRAVAKQHGHEFEACIVQHGPGLELGRMHYQLYVTPDGKVAGTLLLQGINPELDACVGQAVEAWNFGAATANSFFKLKLIWTA